jgi:hypothetical protein
LLKSKWEAIVQSSDLNEHKEKIYLESKKDGAGECFQGIAFILIGIDWSMSNSFSLMWIILILGPFIIIARRKWITYPRLGSYKVSAKRRSMRRRGMGMIIIAGIAAGVFMVWVLNKHVLGLTVEIERQHRFLSGGLFTAFIIVFGILGKLTSFYLVAVANIVFILAAYLLGFPGGFALIMTGVLSLGIGISKLMQFLKAHPVIKPES